MWAAGGRGQEQMWRRLVVVALLLVSVSCSGDEGERSADGPDERRDVASSDDGPGGSRSPTTEGTRVVEDLPVSSDVAECVDDDLGTGQVPDSEAESAVVACQSALVFAPQFEASLRGAYPGVYSEEQLACIADGFGRLTRQESTSLLEGSLVGADDGGVAGLTVLAGLFAACEADPPPAGR